MTVIINCKNLYEREQAHQYLARMLDFPAYYGRNLDALHDCLTEVSGRNLVLLGAEALREAGGYGARILNVFERASQENSGLKLEMR